MFSKTSVTTCTEKADVEVHKFQLNDKAPVNFELNQKKIKKLKEKDANAPLWPMLMHQAEEKIAEEDEVLVIKKEKGEAVNCKDTDYEDICPLAKYQAKITGKAMSIVHLSRGSDGVPNHIDILRQLKNGGHEQMVSMFRFFYKDQEERFILKNFREEEDLGIDFLWLTSQDTQQKKLTELFDDKEDLYLLVPSYMVKEGK
jgi:hypothetical protein